MFNFAIISEIGSLNLKFMLCYTDLVDGPQGHDQDGHKEVGHGQAEDQVVGHVLQISLQQDGGDHEHVAWVRKRRRKLLLTL